MCVFVCAYPELREMESERDTQASGSSAATVDWAEAFKSPEFCAGLAEAIAKLMRTRAASSSQVTDLEQLGDVCPSAMSSATTTGTHSSREGMLINCSFVYWGFRVRVVVAIENKWARRLYHNFGTSPNPPDCVQ